MNNPMEVINAFNQFRSQFKGDPKQTVMNMVASGQISQQQLNQLQVQATQFANILQKMGIKM